MQVMSSDLFRNVAIISLQLYTVYSHSAHVIVIHQFLAFFGNPNIAITLNETYKITIWKSIFYKITQWSSMQIKLKQKLTSAQHSENNHTKLLLLFNRSTNVYISFDKSLRWLLLEMAMSFEEIDFREICVKWPCPQVEDLTGF